VSLSAVARRLLFIRETDGPNAGKWVQFLQRFCYGVKGDSWCADFVSVCMDVEYEGNPPLRRSGSCAVLLAYCEAKGYLVSSPVADGLAFAVDPQRPTKAHHVAITTAAAEPDGRFPTIEGIRTMTGRSTATARPSGRFTIRTFAESGRNIVSPNFHPRHK
jgi:hypothetical protein